MMNLNSVLKTLAALLTVFGCNEILALSINLNGLDSAFRDLFRDIVIGVTVLSTIIACFQKDLSQFSIIAHLVCFILAIFFSFKFFGELQFLPTGILILSFAITIGIAKLKRRIRSRS